MFAMHRPFFFAVVSGTAAVAATFALVMAACGDDPAPPGGDDDGRGDGGAPDADGNVARDGSDEDASDAAPSFGPPRLYVGSSDGKIRVHAFDPRTYALTLIDTVDAGQDPSFCAMDPSARFFYAVDEGRNEVNAFTVGEDGKLSHLQNIGSGGGGPTHVAVDRAGRYVMVANYGGGSVSVFPRSEDGRLGAPTTRAFGGGAQSHQIVTDPNNAFAFVPNKGRDAVAVLRLESPQADAGVYPAGDGARHIDLHPGGRFAYVIDELENTVSAFSLDPTSGALTSIGREPSLPDGTSVSNTGAEIQVLPGGRQLIVSNRGDDSLMVMNIGASDGVPRRGTRVPSGGQSPRHFSVDATGTFLFVGNENSNNVLVMRIDPRTGVPSPVGEELSVPSPRFAGIFYLPR